jgi:hypothetical protein
VLCLDGMRLQLQGYSDLPGVVADLLGVVAGGHWPQRVVGTTPAGGVLGCCQHSDCIADSLCVPCCLLWAWSVPLASAMDYCAGSLMTAVSMCQYASRVRSEQLKRRTQLRSCVLWVACTVTQPRGLRCRVFLQARFSVPGRLCLLIKYPKCRHVPLPFAAFTVAPCECAWCTFSTCM